MKKFLFAVMAILLVTCTAVVAQAPDPPGPINYADVFMTFAAFSAAIPFIVEFLKKLIPIQGQWLAWVVGLALSGIGWLLQLGIFAGLIWYQALIIGLFGALAAVGLFNTGLIVWILQTLGILKVTEAKKR